MVIKRFKLKKGLGGRVNVVDTKDNNRIIVSFATVKEATKFANNLNKPLPSITNPSTPKNKWIRVKAIKFLGGGKIQVLK